MSEQSAPEKQESRRASLFINLEAPMLYGIAYETTPEGEINNHYRFEVPFEDGIDYSAMNELTKVQDKYIGLSDINERQSCRLTIEGEEKALSVIPLKCDFEGGHLFVDLLDYNLT